MSGQWQQNSLGNWAPSAWWNAAPTAWNGGPAAWNGGPAAWNGGPAAWNAAPQTAWNAAPSQIQAICTEDNDTVRIELSVGNINKGDLELRVTPLSIALFCSGRPLWQTVLPQGMANVAETTARLNDNSILSVALPKTDEARGRTIAIQ